MLLQRHFATLLAAYHTVNIITQMIHYALWTAHHLGLDVGVLWVTMLQKFSWVHVLHVQMENLHFILVLKL